MPNWVSNYVSVTGKREDLLAFAEKAKRPHPAKSGNEEIVMETPDALSFWNFIAPPQEAIDSGEYFGTHGFSEGKAQGNTDNNWYNFNNREWNTKWDACSDCFGGNLNNLEDKDTITYQFDTAWSIPEPVFRAMVEQHPELDFFFECEEEQGWGAKFQSIKGELNETDSWDIPNSHADYAERDRVDSCVCAWDEDSNEWYADCPNSTSTAVVKEELQIIYD